MPDRKPPGWFEAGSHDEDDPDFERRRKRLLAELPKLLERQKERGRADSFYPYLLVRSVLGDRGDRPINVPFWESPDIWTAPGEPQHTPDVPDDHGGVVRAGEPQTLYAHVWNLGLAPLAGVFVEFYWCNPSLAIDEAHAHQVGIARCELAARGMKGSHKLVKCPKRWLPVVENGGHECLVVRVQGIGDPLGANEWDPWLNRHVAQRNVSVVSTEQSLAPLIAKLGEISKFHRLQLVQVGAGQAEMAARIVAPAARIPERVRTHVLADLRAEREVAALDPSPEPPAGTLAPVHALAADGAPVAPKLGRTGAVAVIDPRATLRRLPEPIEETPVATLLGSVGRLHEGAATLDPPADEEAHVLRLANYDSEGQLVGGYTLIVTGT